MEWTAMPRDLHDEPLAETKKVERKLVWIEIHDWQGHRRPLQSHKPDVPALYEEQHAPSVKKRLEDMHVSCAIREWTKADAKALKQHQKKFYEARRKAEEKAKAEQTKESVNADMGSGPRND